ncbi:MAG: hypothetical protein Tsb0027_01900 [Wenzhouxiangellaceae bacterium]
MNTPTSVLATLVILIPLVTMSAAHEPAAEGGSDLLTDTVVNHDPAYGCYFAIVFLPLRRRFSAIPRGETHVKASRF